MFLAVFDFDCSAKRRRKSISMFPYSYYDENQPTLDGVKRDISKIVGLTEIKLQLEAIVEKIDVVEKQASYGLRIAPPKPFHTVFIGNCGTGKSTVAKILAKLFYLAGTLPSCNVTEMQGLAFKLKAAEGGVLVVDVDQEEYNPHLLEEIISTMDEGKTSVIFAGSRKSLNRCANMNRDLYNRFSAKLQFNDFSCEELAEMLRENIREEKDDNFAYGYKLDSSCSIEMVGEIIAEETCETLRNKLNGYLVYQILEDARSCLKSRLGCHDGVNDQNIITLEDIKNGVRIATKRYKDDMIF